MKTKLPAPVMLEPTSWSVQEIFNELIPDRYRADESSKDDHAYLQACEAVSARERELERDQKLVRLRKCVEDAHAAAVKKRIAVTDAARRVRRLYNAKGLTPDVKAELVKLVELANKK